MVRVQGGLIPPSDKHTHLLQEVLASLQIGNYLVRIGSWITTPSRLVSCCSPYSSVPQWPPDERVLNIPKPAPSPAAVFGLALLRSMMAVAPRDGELGRLLAVPCETETA